MTTSPAQYAALAEWIYARDSVDQALSLDEIGAGQVIDAELVVNLDPALGLTRSSGNYYSERGFVGTIIQQGPVEDPSYIVVLRGSDWESGD